MTEEQEVYIKEKLIGYANVIQNMLDNGKSFMDVRQWSHENTDPELPYLETSEMLTTTLILIPALINIQKILTEFHDQMLATPPILIPSLINKQKMLIDFFNQIADGCIALRKYNFRVEEHALGEDGRTEAPKVFFTERTSRTSAKNLL